MSTKDLNTKDVSTKDASTKDVNTKDVNTNIDKIEHPWLKRMHEYKYLSSLSENPSKTRAIFVVAEEDLEANEYNSYLYELKGDKPKQLTALGKEGSYIWETDNTVLFQANRTKKEQKRQDEGVVETNFYRLNLDGGEALPAFTIPMAASGLTPVGDGKFLFFASLGVDEEDIWTWTEKDRNEHYKEKKDKSWRTELTKIPFVSNGRGFQEDKRRRLFSFDANTSEIKSISPKSHVIHGLQLTPDKTKAYFTGAKAGSKSKLTDGLWELDIATLKIKLISLDTKLSISYVFSFNDELYMLASCMQDIGINQNSTLWTWDFDKREATEVSREELLLGNSVGTDIYYGGTRAITTNEDDLLMVQTLGTKSVLNRFNSNFELEDVVTKPGAVEAFAEVNGEIIVLALYDMKLAEIYRVVDKDTVEQLTHFNDHLYEEFSPLVPKKLNIKSPADDCEIEGFVLLPPEFDAEAVGKYPAILNIHGGPKTAYGEVYSHEMQTWAHEGYVVFFTNPHGSSGRGDKFSDIRGKYGDVDYEDIMAFTDAVLEAYPAIDVKTLGVTGGSYGGFMTNWITSHTNRFKAAATQRSITNWTSFYGTSDIGFYFATDQNKTTIEEKDMFKVMWEHSPMKYIDNVKTPTLIIHADEDYRCPVEQAYQWLVGLLDRDVEAKMVLFHGENHELSRSGKPQARQKRLLEITAWMNRHVKGVTEDNVDMEACVMGFC